MSIYLCGVFSGQLTGQMQTLFTIRDVLEDKFDLKLMNSPSMNKYFPFAWSAYIAKAISVCVINKKPHLFYIIINRSRISFWLRDLPIYIIASATKSKLICHLVGSDIEHFIHNLNFIEKFLLIKYFKKIDAWVLLGNSMKTQVDNVYRDLKIQDQSSCYHNGELISHELRGFYPVESDNYFDRPSIDAKIENFGDNITIGYMSNLMEEKGIVEFIESMIFLKERLGYDINVWIAGAFIGQSTDRLSHAMSLAKTKNYITILGLAGGGRKWNGLLETDIFILPSYYKTEALPLSLVEAMRFGCLCISSSIGEINDLLGNDRGIIIDTISTNNIVLKVEGVLADTSRSKAMIQNSLSYASDEFSYETYKIKLLTLVESFIK